MRLNDCEIGPCLTVLDQEQNSPELSVFGADPSALTVFFRPGFEGGLIATLLNLRAADSLLTLSLCNPDGFCWLTLSLKSRQQQPRIDVSRHMSDGFVLTTDGGPDGLAFVSTTGQCVHFPPLDSEFHRFRRRWRGSGRFVVQPDPIGLAQQLGTTGASVATSDGTQLFRLMIREADGALAVRFARLTITLCGDMIEMFALSILRIVRSGRVFVCWSPTQKRFRCMTRSFNSLVQLCRTPCSRHGSFCELTMAWSRLAAPDTLTAG